MFSLGLVEPYSDVSLPVFSEMIVGNDVVQLGIHFMRLNFELKKINISPVVHIQILRHADEFENKYASGELYGALYDDEAEVTNILPFPEKEKMQTKEDL